MIFAPVYYFGFIVHHGHGAMLPGGGRVYDVVGPFQVWELDAGEFLPTAYRGRDRWLGKREPQSEFRLTHARGWTIIASWDRSGDPRGASNCSFLSDGTRTFDEMMDLARRHFPGIVRRIEAAKPIVLFFDA